MHIRLNLANKKEMTWLTMKLNERKFPNPISFKVRQRDLLREASLGCNIIAPFHDIAFEKRMKTTLCVTFKLRDGSNYKTVSLSQKQNSITSPFTYMQLMPIF